jgi:8-oxo-dGTP pyrophosphatase MutT (NUDIX family)
VLVPGQDPRPALVEALRRHTPADPEEARDRDQILAFVERHQRPFDRAIREGHLTGSAIVVSADASQVLLLHHRKLDRWLQPGGHGDEGETTGEQVALREAREESGIAGLALHESAPRPLDVDVHDIPARDDEPAHQHLDLRYLVVAPPGAAAAPELAELHEIRWVAWDEAPALDPDHGLRRALAKARSLVRPSAAGARRSLRSQRAPGATAARAPTAATRRPRPPGGGRARGGRRGQ